MLSDPHGGVAGSADHPQAGHHEMGEGVIRLTARGKAHELRDHFEAPIRASSEETCSCVVGLRAAVGSYPHGPSTMALSGVFGQVAQAGRQI